MTLRSRLRAVVGRNWGELWDGGLQLGRERRWKFKPQWAEDRQSFHCNSSSALEQVIERVSGELWEVESGVTIFRRLRQIDPREQGFSLPCAMVAYRRILREEGIEALRFRHFIFVFCPLWDPPHSTNLQGRQMCVISGGRNVDHSSKTEGR